MSKTSNVTSARHCPWRVDGRIELHGFAGPWKPPRQRRTRGWIRRCTCPRSCAQAQPAGSPSMASPGRTGAALPPLPQRLPIVVNMLLRPCYLHCLPDGQPAHIALVDLRTACLMQVAAGLRGVEVVHTQMPGTGVVQMDRSLSHSMSPQQQLPASLGCLKILRLWRQSSKRPFSH